MRALTGSTTTRWRRSAGPRKPSQPKPAMHPRQLSLSRAAVRGLLLAGLLLGCSGCPFHPASSAPPMTLANLPTSGDKVDLTQGVALAISCHDPWWGHPCRDMKVSSDDPGVATVSLMHLDKYRRYDGFSPAQHPRTVFLIAGVEPGVTSVQINSDVVNERLKVRVHPLHAGAIGAPAKVMRAAAASDDNGSDRPK